MDYVSPGGAYPVGAGSAWMDAGASGGKGDYILIVFGTHRARYAQSQPGNPGHIGKCAGGKQGLFIVRKSHNESVWEIWKDQRNEANCAVGDTADSGGGACHMARRELNPL